jgi:FAD/FMN-containing dehydrogenase
MNTLLDKIIQSLGEGIVIQDDSDLERHSVDASGDPPVMPGAVLRPSSTRDVSTVLKLCNEAAQPLTIQGGLTGLAGGAIPGPGELVLSLERMVGIEEIDTDSMTLTALAGTPLETIQKAASEAGFLFPLDLGARGSCHIGGNVSTNAGGNGVIRYGMIRALVLGLEAVMADGTVIRSMNKMLKNNAGYDLKHLFIGSEGTLGVVTRVVLRLFPARAGRHTALCALERFEDVVSLLHAVQGASGGISAFEVMWSGYYHYAINEVESLRDPFAQKHPFYVLLEQESSGSQADQEQFEQMLFGQIESGVLADSVISQSLRDAEMFWQIRDAVGDFMPRLKSFANFDVSVPVSQAKLFTERVEAEFEHNFPGATIFLFGHLGDSNLHIIATTGDETGKQKIYELIYGIIRDFDGSVSAEHGIGRHKRKYLDMSRNDEELKLMRTLKLAMDPKGVLNPGRVL